MIIHGRLRFGFSVSHFASYIRSLVAFGEPRLTEINWLFESLITSLKAAQRNAEFVRASQSITSLRHAKNLLSFLSRSLSDLPDETLVEHLEEFFEYMEESVDKAIQLPIADEIEELSALVLDLRAGWEKLIAPTTSAPYDRKLPSSSVIA